MTTLKNPTALAFALAFALACAGVQEEVKPQTEAAKAAAAQAKADAGKTPEQLKTEAEARLKAEKEAAESKLKAAKEAAAAELQKQLAALPTTPDAEFRTGKPPPAPGTPAFTAPVPSDKKLKSGARLLVVENHALPIVALSVVFQAGADVEPIAKAGLADFTAMLLRESTKKHSTLELAGAFEDLAANFGTSAAAETSGISLNCLQDTLPKCLDLLVEVLTEPAFKTEDVERIRALTLTDLVRKKSSPGALAQDEMAHLLFGEKHPLGQPNGGTPETIKAITQADLVKFHDAWYRPNNAVISVSGDTTAAEMQKLLDARLKAWKSKSTARPKLPALPAMAQGVTLIDKPGSQSQVWMIGRLFPAKDPDAIPFRVANNVLGGLFGSRLNMNLREEKSWSYGVRSTPQLLRSTGSFVAAGGIQAQYTAEALGEYLKELKAFATGELKDGELAKAKEAVIRILPSALETNGAVAGSIAGLVMSGLPLDYYKTLPAKVAKVDAKDLARVAKKYIVLTSMHSIVVGPADKSADKLKALAADVGPLELKAATPAPAPAAAPAAK